MADEIEDSGVEVLHSGTSSLKRSGAWQVSPRMRIVSLTGGVKLDFREAKLPAGPIDIEIEGGTGAIDLILPAGATADLSGLLQATGHLRSAAPAQPAPGRAHFTVHGLVGTGGVRVDYRPKLLGLF